MSSPNRCSARMARLRISNGQSRHPQENVASAHKPRHASHRQPRKDVWHWRTSKANFPRPMFSSEVTKEAWSTADLFQRLFKKNARASTLAFDDRGSRRPLALDLVCLAGDATAPASVRGWSETVNL